MAKRQQRDLGDMVPGQRNMKGMVWRTQARWSGSELAKKRRGGPGSEEGDTREVQAKRVATHGY